MSARTKNIGRPTGEILKGKRVISFFPQVISPPSSGAHVGLWQRLESYMALGAEVHLVAPQASLPKSSNWSPEARRATESKGVHLHLAPAHFGTVDFWWAALWQVTAKKIGRVIWPRPDSIYYWRPQLAAYWRRLVKSGQFDLAMVNYATWCQFLPPARRAGLKTVVEMHDLLARQYESRHEVAGRPPRTPQQIQAYEASEVRLLGLADLIISVNPEETRWVESKLGRPVLTLPFGLREAHCPTAPSTTDVLVVGSGIEHNKKGLRQFLQEAWPEIIRRRPQTTLTVCGGVGEILTGAEIGTTRIRFAPDLAPHYVGAKIILLCTVSGSGIKIKALEAMSHGGCIVAHDHSVEALEFDAGVHGEVVHDLGQSAPVIVELLESPARRERLQSACRLLFRSKYSFEATLVGLGDALRPLFAEGR